LETVAELDTADLRSGAVLVNRARPTRLPNRSVTVAAGGRVDACRVRSGLLSAGLDLDPAVLDGLVTQTVEHAGRVELEQQARTRLEEAGLPTLELPELHETGVDGVDLGGIYELAELILGWNTL
jgi:hypothetical protein